MRKYRMRWSIFALGLLTMLMIGGTFAYFQKSSTIDNHLQAAEPKVYLNENFNPDDEWLPGEEKQKEVRFGNEGNMATVLRVRFISSLEENGSQTDISDKVTLNFNLPSFTDNWVKGQDGWYYYNKVLLPDAVTDITLKSVTISDQIGNDEHGIQKDYSGAVFDVQIRGELLQASLAEEIIRNNQNWGLTPSINGDQITWS